MLGKCAPFLICLACSGAPPPEIGGAWTGKWSSGRGLTGPATVTFDQSGSSIKGTFTMDKSPCITGGTVEGSVDGQHLTGHLKSGTSHIEVDLTLTDTDRMDGTYDAVAAGLCSGDKGAVTLSREK